MAHMMVCQGFLREVPIWDSLLVLQQKLILRIILRWKCQSFWFNSVSLIIWIEVTSTMIPFIKLKIWNIISVFRPFIHLGKKKKVLLRMVHINGMKMIKWYYKVLVMTYQLKCLMVTSQFSKTSLENNTLLRMAMMTVSLFPITILISLEIQLII